MDALTVAQRSLGVVKFVMRLDGAKDTALGMARGVGEGTLRSEPPIIRMVLGVADGGMRAHAAHQASLGVRLVNAAYDVVKLARTGG
jgi:hypothetical protein